MSIEVRNVSKTFGRYQALRDVTLTVPAGELVALLGPSGCGKTTLLRIIAGLERPDAGSGPIRFYEEDVARQNVRDRHVGFVFQHYSLFRHMTIFDNVAFGLKVKPRSTRPTDGEIRDKVMSLLRLVQLDGIAYRYPAQLSGGQRQRVALARALAVEPRVLLLDEPFGALDATVRVELRRWLRRLHDDIRLTSVFVTHDQEEALEVADRVVIMNEGKIEQIGTPDEVFHNPATPFVMKFIGTVNSFHGRMEGSKVLVADDADEVQIFVRPHEFDLHLESRGELSIAATVDRVHSAGPFVRLELLDGSGRRLFVSLSQEAFASMHLAKGSVVYVTPRDVRVFKETTPV